MLQLPIPQLEREGRTGNIPLGAACLKLATADLPGTEVKILPESDSSYLGDAALIDAILAEKPDMVGFTVYCWNLERSTYISEELKNRTNAEIVFGGPEITPDNPLLRSPAVDFHVFGEGEETFRRLLQNPGMWEKKSASIPSESIFRNSKSPYLYGLLEPEIEDVMLIETQRGCPHRCGFCNYNKARGRISSVPAETVLEGVRWAKEMNISEVFLLDPSLNARRDLSGLLAGIKEINSDRKLSFQSEIRAEGVDPNLAAAFSGAGFSEFEIGLQTIGAKAGKLMNRSLDIENFLRGVKNLRDVGIRSRIDLIIGLPGDDLEGFRASVDFVADNGMGDDVQVFFLSVLPGTDFRKNSVKLGLTYESRPPYTIVETSGFGGDDMLSAFCYAEERFDVSLKPGPGLDLSYKTAGGPVPVPEEGRVSKIVPRAEIPVSELKKIARRLSHPYQIVFLPGLLNKKFMLKTVGIFTGENPHTPLEIVFWGPADSLNVEEFEAALKLQRPLYLDLDSPAFGSRSVLFTLVSTNEIPVFEDVMKRQVYSWKIRRLPNAAELDGLMHLGGVLIDNDATNRELKKWQDGFAEKADDLPLITFSEISMQERWAGLTESQ